MNSLTIGKVAHHAGVGVETVRFYEREGLIEKPPRRVSGYRQYPEEAIFRIRFIKRAKELGFSLKEINGLLSLRAKPRGRCADVKIKAEDKIKDIDQKIRSLEAMREALNKLIAECSGKGPTSACPILDALDENGV